MKSESIREMCWMQFIMVNGDKFSYRKKHTTITTNHRPNKTKHATQNSQGYFAWVRAIWPYISVKITYKTNTKFKRIRKGIKQMVFQKNGWIKWCFLRNILYTEKNRRTNKNEKITRTSLVLFLK
jgi:hypothetical protein